MKNGRRNEAETAADAIARALLDIGMPVPESLLEMTATPGHAVPATPTPEDSQAARVRELRALGWPLRALEIAAVADVGRAAMRAVDRWNPSMSAIVLAGAVGAGKTVAAAWWALGARNAFRFVRAAELVRVGRFDDSWRAWLGAPALCVDDLGAEYADAKGSFVADLDHLFDTFYADRRPLIVTTNCDGAAFRARYGERIADRLTECAVWAYVDGVSLRTRP